MSKKRHSTIWLHFAGIVFVTVAVVFLTISLVWWVLFEFNVVQSDPHGKKIPLFLLFASSVLIGGTIAIYVGRVIIRPIQNIGRAFKELSEGNFDVKISETEPIDEIKEIVRQFNAMTCDLSHTETLRTDFVANVSHEFKTPISSIEGYAALLQKKDLTEEKHDYYLQKIIENTRRLSGLTSNMLLLSKLENQELVLYNKCFRLDEQIRKTILLLEDEWTKKDVRFDMDLPDIVFYGSEQLLERVWSNIIGNAIKYSKQGGVVSIKIDKSDSEVCVQISDEGQGMGEEVLKHAFEKFYQGDPSRKTEGSGLGLALVKRIVDVCQGSVTARSTLGKGTTFEVRLPYSVE